MSRHQVKLLTGRITDGYGVAAKNLRHVTRLIEERMGLSPLIPGTLNIALSEPYVVSANAVIEKHEYNNLEYINLQRCRIRGIQAIIMRPNTHELGCAHGLANLELLATVNLRHHLQLADGDEVDVEVEGDEQWWRRSNA